MRSNFSARLVRNQVSAIARRIGILQFLDRIYYYYTQLRHLSQNRQFMIQNPQFKVPPAELAFDAYNVVSWSEYYRSGLEVANYVTDLIQEQLKTKQVRLLEWGCGPARIIRHLPGLLEDGSEIFGTDYNQATISWCQNNIDDVTFVENHLAPPLPFAENSFECIYGFSVLTHLSEEMCKAWVVELSRVTKTNGYIFLSTKGEMQQARMLPGEVRALKNGEPVFRGNIVEGKKMFDTILPTTYMKNVLFDGFEIVQHVPAKESDSHHEQDLWIVRNP